MKGFFLSLILFLAIALILPAAAQAVDYAASWDVAVREAGNKNYYLPMTDGRLVIESGSQSARYNQLTFTGSVGQDGLHLACTVQAKPCGTLVLQLAGDRLSGKGTLMDGDGLERPVTLSGTRPGPLRAPRTIDLEPTKFYNVYSAEIAPVLHLAPGDTVRTRTLDSRGQDRDGKPRAPRGNPLTGPFISTAPCPATRWWCIWTGCAPIATGPTRPT